MREPFSNRHSLTREDIAQAYDFLFVNILNYDARLCLHVSSSVAGVLEGVTSVGATDDMEICMNGSSSSNLLSKYSALSEKDRAQAIGFLFVNILNHVALLWLHQTGEPDLIDLFKANLKTADELSEAAKDMVRVVLEASDFSVKSTLEELRVGTSGMN